MLAAARDRHRGRGQPVPAGPRHRRRSGRRSSRTVPATTAWSTTPTPRSLVTTGATEALAAAILAFVEPGDEVIALEPFYDSYAASIDLAGGTRVGVGLFGPDFRLDLAEFEAAITPRDQGVVDQLPAQPDRHRARRRAIGPDRRAGRRSTICWSSATRCTSTWSSTTSSTARSPTSRGCVSGPSASPRRARRSRRPAGRSAGRWGRRS